MAMLIIKILFLLSLSSPVNHLYENDSHGKSISLLTLPSPVNHFFSKNPEMPSFGTFFTNKNFLIHKMKIVGDKKLPRLMPSEEKVI